MDKYQAKFDIINPPMCSCPPSRSILDRLQLSSGKSPLDACRVYANIIAHTSSTPVTAINLTTMLAFVQWTSAQATTTTAYRHVSFPTNAPAQLHNVRLGGFIKCTTLNIWIMRLILHTHPALTLVKLFETLTNCPTLSTGSACRASKGTECGRSGVAQCDTDTLW